MEADCSNNNSRDFFKEVKNTRRSFQPTSIGMKDRNGNLITNEQAVRERWVEHFTEQFNSPPPANNIAAVEFLELVAGEEEPPSRREVRETIKELKNNKAPGDDMFPAEFFKASSEVLTNEIHKFLTIVWNQETIPHLCNDAIITALYKKEDKEICSNYRGLSLLTTIYKIIARIVYKRLLPYAEPVLGEYQAGFRSNSSTSDQIFTLRQVLEKRWEYNKSSHLIFIDFKQA